MFDDVVGVDSFVCEQHDVSACGPLVSSNRFWVIQGSVSFEGFVSNVPLRGIYIPHLRAWRIVDVNDDSGRVVFVGRSVYLFGVAVGDGLSSCWFDDGAVCVY